MAGFLPIRHMHGNIAPTGVRRYRACTSTAIFIGDMLGFSAGVVKPVQSASAACIGPAVRCYDAGQKSFVHAMPSRGPFKPAAISGFVDVCDDPDTVFLATAEVSVSSGTTLLLTQTVTASTGVTAVGYSSQKLVIPASATQGHVKVIGVAQTNLDGLDGAGTQVECIIVRHALRGAT